MLGRENAVRTGEQKMHAASVIRTRAVPSFDECKFSSFRLRTWTKIYMLYINLIFVWTQLIDGVIYCFYYYCYFVEYLF
jgi:hypothetical protein